MSTESITEEIENIWGDGLHDMEMGSVDYPLGHIIFQELNGEFYALRTDNQGFKTLTKFDDRCEWDDMIMEVEKQEAAYWLD